MKRKITFVQADDWEGLYINGVLVCEEHSICVEHLLSALKIPATTIQADYDWLVARGRLPEKLSDVKTE